MNLYYNSYLIFFHKQSGGSADDYKAILYKLNNNYNDHFVIDIKGNNHYFKILEEFNKKNEYGSKYIGHGAHSCVFVANDLQNNNKIVLKILFIPNKSDFLELQKLQEWYKRFYALYRIIKKRFGNMIGTIYGYGDNLLINNNNNHLNDTIDGMPIDYNTIIINSRMAHTICKFYQTNIDYKFIGNRNLYKIIFILCSIFIGLQNNNNSYYIYDLKLENLVINDENIYLIDFTEELIVFYKKNQNNKYIYFDKICMTSYIPCYLRKILFFHIKDNLDNINQKAENNTYVYSKDNDNKNRIIKQNIEINKEIHKKIKSKKIGYLTNESEINLFFDKTNCISLAEIILNLYFKPFYINNDGVYIDISIIVLYDKFNIIYNNKEGDNPFVLNSTNYYHSSILSRFKAVHNLNDIRILTKFIYEFIIPNDNINSDYITQLKILLFDPDSETGLLAPEYDDIPTYQLICKFLYDINLTSLSGNGLFTDQSMNDLIAYFINLNNGVQAFDKNTLSTDTQTYRQWKEERLRIKNNSNIQLDNSIKTIFPPVNSKFRYTEIMTLDELYRVQVQNIKPSDELWKRGQIISIQDTEEYIESVESLKIYKQSEKYIEETQLNDKKMTQLNKNVLIADLRKYGITYVIPELKQINKLDKQLQRGLTVNTPILATKYKKYKLKKIL